MNLPAAELWLAGWVGVMSLWAFGLFGYDKAVAGRAGVRRVSERNLCLVSALGGWPGGLLGLLLFRHKSAKAAFHLKFTLAFIVWAALVGGALRMSGRI